MKLYNSSVKFDIIPDDAINPRSFHGVCTTVRLLIVSGSSQSLRAMSSESPNNAQGVLPTGCFKEISNPAVEIPRTLRPSQNAGSPRNESPLKNPNLKAPSPQPPKAKLT